MGDHASEIQRFAALFEEVGPAVYAWAEVRLNPALRRILDPQDILQEVGIRAFARFAAYDAELRPFRAWVFGIAANVLKEAFREIARGRSMSGVQASADPTVSVLLATSTAVSRRVARSETVKRLLDAVNALPEDEKKLVMLRGLEGLSFPEISEIMQIDVETAKKRWQRLRSRLAELCPDEAILAT